ncbi:histidinol-phosphatase [Marinilabilia sp.]|uniref:histidinol-phosphatase n=1 Tax=Marinilabilia sp. TaxID=2021252 RepID=UPI0025B86D0C|nr:histidinol-phosphatase [Marinilabilia sp.]
MSRSWANYHGHSFFCDGQGAPEEYVLKAIDLGISTLGISSHAPLPFDTGWNMPLKKMPVYLNQLSRLKQKYRDRINLLTSMEVDYIPLLMGPGHPRIQTANLDYIVGSVHFVETFADGCPFSIDDATPIFEKGINEIFKGDIRKLIKRYFELQREMLEKEPPQIIGHLDKIRLHNRNQFFFDEKADWYIEEVRSTMMLAAGKGVIVEINTKFFEATAQTFPDKGHFKWMAANNIPITINSDAHKPDNLLSGFAVVA